MQQQQKSIVKVQAVSSTLIIEELERDDLFEELFTGYSDGIDSWGPRFKTPGSGSLCRPNLVLSSSLLWELCSLSCSTITRHYDLCSAFTVRHETTWDSGQLGFVVVVG